VQCCGDAHLSNFGVFASPERRLVFDLNDFDETLPGPWEWDVKRLAVSMLVAAQDNGYRAKDQGAHRAWRPSPAISRGDEELRLDDQSRGFGTPTSRSRALPRGTRAAAEAEHGKSAPGRRSPRRARRTAWRRSQSSCTWWNGPSARFRRRTAADRSARGSRPGPVRARSCASTACRTCCARIAARSQDDRRGPPGAVSAGRLRAQGRGRRPASATRAWIALMLGRDDQDPLILQMKEAEASVLEGPLGASRFENHGERVRQRAAADAGQQATSSSAGSTSTPASTVRHATSTVAS